MKKHTDFSRTLYKIVACATLLLTVGVFLERSGKYYVGTEAGGERKHVCTSLEEAKKLADQNAVYGWSVFDFNGRLVYTTYSPLAAEILREAKTDNGLCAGGRLYLRRRTDQSGDRLQRQKGQLRQAGLLGDV